MNLNLEVDICEVDMIMEKAKDFGLFLRKRGITGKNISDFPDVKKEFDEISYAGRKALKTNGLVPVVLGIFGVFVRDPINFVISQRYMQNKVVPYCQSGCSCR